MGVSSGPHSPADGGAVVLGIDPGTASTGFGVVERRGAVLASRGGGVISTKPNLPLEHRLAAISSFLQDLIAEHRPAALAIEEIFFGRNVRTAFAVGQARGAVLAAAGAEGVPCFAYTPQAVKLAVCGSGRAGKEQVQRMVAALLSLPEPPASDHAADALALAICHQNNLPLAAKEKNQPLAAKAARGSAGLRGRTSAQPRRIPNT
jgi:crossover junction endodeoxyribonuclease RuvC